jgi:hypothetical protein
MKKRLRILQILLLVVVAAVVVVVVGIGLFADHAVKIGIETAATKTLSVGVTLDKADLAIMAGRLTLDNLKIANPPGYQHDKLLELKDGKIAVDIKSLLGEVVNIKEIKLDRMDVTLEQRGVSSNNLQDILESLPKSPQGQQKSEPSGKKLRIETLRLTNVTVNAKLLPIPGKADTITLKLAPIEMTDLGGDNKLDTAGLTAKVLMAVARGIAEQGAGVLPDDMLATMTSTLDKAIGLGKDVLEGGKDLGKGVLEQGKDLGKGVEDIGKGIGDGLKNILNSGKKD